MMVKKAVSELLKGLLAKIDVVLFRYQVKAGLILCAVEPGEEEEVAQTGEEEETGAATGSEETAAGKETSVGSEDEEEVVVTIGEESPPSEEEETAHAPEWVKELRKSHRELTKRNRELEEKLKANETAETKPAEVGKKPTLEGCDFDAEKFEQELASWHERKRVADEAAAAADNARKEQETQWQARLNDYGKLKSELKVKDMDEAEAVAQESLSVVQQGIIVKGAENPALLIYALGKNPKKAKELSAINDPVKFAFAVAKLETQLKVNPRKAPPPEKTVAAGTGNKGSSVDSNLERLRAEAEKTGDHSKVIAYKRQLRQKRAA